MANKLVSVFFYGHYMDKQKLRRRGFTAVASRRAQLHGMRLVIGNRAYLTPNEKESVFGVVVEMTKEEVDQFYAHPDVREYRAENVLVRLDDGTSLKTLCYNLSTETDVETASPDYTAELLSTASRLGLPKPYIDKLNQRFSPGHLED